MITGVTLAIRADCDSGRRERATDDPIGRRRFGATDAGSGRVIAP